MDALIIADDLSGAADCAAAGRRASVVALNWPPLPGGGLVAVDLNSRRATAAEAAVRARRAVEQLATSETRVVYQKLDSLLRGNWGAELAAIRDALRTQRGQPYLAILTPAWPERGRTFVDGVVHLGGTPLGGKGLHADDGTALDGDVAAGLAEAHLSSIVIAEGDAADLHNQLLDAAQGGIAVAICEASTRAHLDTIAAVSARLADRVFWAGSAGLMGSLSSALGWRADDVATMAPPAAPVLIMVGSASETSRRQLEHLRQAGTPIVSLSPRDLGANADTARLANVSATIAALVDAGSSVAVTIQGEALPDLRGGADLVTRMGQLLLPFISRFGGLILTGGETARTILDAMGVPALRLLGECEPGVPLAMTSGPLSVPVITKAGAFGGPATLTDAFATLQGRAGSFFSQ